MPDPATPLYTLNPNAKIDVYRIGNEGQPVFVVDNALTNPEELRDFAREQAKFIEPAQRSQYPGLNASLPKEYLSAVIGATQRPLVELFGVHPNARLPNYGFFGLATIGHHAMAPAQAIPHIDSIKANSFATVHYLDGTDFGGTAFYRQKSTGFEAISPVRSYKFIKTQEAELEAYKGMSPVDLLDLYEEIIYFEAVFNRLILYRANQLHSPRMKNSDNLSADPRQGRLTANIFINTE